MSNLLTQPRVQWVTAAPLWSQAASPASAMNMRQPALLRFERDTFMDDLLALLQQGQPADLAGHVAAPVSYRARPLGEPLRWTAPAPEALKLYQPIHGHFNLVAASLVCQMPGMPDRTIDAAQEEQAGFVLRRLDASGREMAWIPDGSLQGWQTVLPGQPLAPGEELLPLFPLNFRQDGRPRRLLAGLVPTSARETFQAAPEQRLAAPISEEDPRLIEALARVIEPLRELQGEDAAPLNDPRYPQQIEASRFILLDLADLLATQAPDIWDAVNTGASPATNEARLLVALLARPLVTPGSGPTWSDALRAAWSERARITGESAEPPTLTFNLRDSTMNPDTMNPDTKDPDTLRARLEAALSKSAVSPDSRALAAPSVPKLDPRPETRYVVRCVYRRANCAPSLAHVVSAASAPFAIASFFDFDAPARPIRITMPLDTSAAGLRKFRNNVSILISDGLRKQMGSVTDLKKLLGGTVDSSQGVNLGVLCSFSIPIITICALIVLIIFVSLLDIIFRWLPFFRICLPIRLKAK